MKEVEAICIRNCWEEGNQFFPGEKVMIDPMRRCAVHFRFAKDPKVKHPKYTFDKEKGIFVREKAEVPPKPPPPLPEFIGDNPEEDKSKPEAITETAPAVKDKAPEEDKKPSPDLQKLQGKK